MRELFEKITGNGFTGYVLAGLYILVDLLIVAFLPAMFTFKNEALKNTLDGMQGTLFIIQVILFIMILIVPFIAMREGGGSGAGIFSKASKYGDQGSAKMGSVSALSGLTGRDGIVLSKRIRLKALKSYEHVLVLGPTGSGKSTSYFIPNILDLDGSHSIVVTDPKGELHDLTYNHLSKLGYDIVKLEPLNMNCEFFYNPVIISEDNTQLKDIAQLILSNGGKAIEVATGASASGAEWVNMAVPLLAASIIYTSKFGVEKSIGEAVELILKEDHKSLEKRFKDDKGAYKQFLIYNASAGSERTLSSIKSVLSSNVQIFFDEKIENFTKTRFTINRSGDKIINYKKMFNPKDLRDRPTALFICVPEIKSLPMMPLMSVIYSQILDVTMTYKGEYPIHFFLDEFANIGIIPSIANVAATARSRRISLSLGLQGVEQLKRNYGDENASDILNNLKSKLVFSGLSGESAQYISDLSGVTTVETVSVSNNSGAGQDMMSNLMGAGKSVSKSGTKRELVTKDELRTMDDGEVLVIAHNRNPVKDKKNTWYTQPKYKKKLKEADEWMKEDA